MHTPASPTHPICVLGSLFLDLVMTGLRHTPRAGEEQWVDDFGMMAGGCANQAVALARLGLPVALRAYIGTDDAGTLVRSFLERDSLTVDHCVSAPSQNVTVSLSFDGDRAMTTVGTDSAPTLSGLPFIPSTLVTDLTGVSANLDTITQWRSSDVATRVIGDVGWDNTDRWDPQDLAPLSHVDVFVPNETEATRYTRTTTPADAARVLARRTPLAVITCGADGVVACDDHEIINLPAVPVTLVDPTGAGDSFSAGLTVGLSHGLSLRSALSLASLTASATLSRPGGSANAPTPQDLLSLTRTVPLPEGYDLSFLDLPLFSDPHPSS